MLPIVSTFTRARTVVGLVNGVRHDGTYTKILGGATLFMVLGTFGIAKCASFMYNDIKERMTYYYETKGKKKRGKSQQGSI